jgi:hypothetical protein
MTKDVIICYPLKAVTLQQVIDTYGTVVQGETKTLGENTASVAQVSYMILVGVYVRLLWQEVCVTWN